MSLLIVNDIGNCASCRAKLCIFEICTDRMQQFHCRLLQNVCEKLCRVIRTGLFEIYRAL